jgi:MoxR-like ATPase
VIPIGEPVNEAERQANDLDYDERGRLKFAPTELAADIANSIGDAKGGSAAPRMTYTRQRRYGARHIEARTRQIDDALARIAGYAEEVARQRDDLAGTAAAIASLAQRLRAAREGFLALPRLERDDANNDALPEPVAHESLAA